jgi:hypothetical protein
MKTLLPIAPASASNAPTPDAAPRDAEETVESFASVLDRCHSAKPPHAGRGEAKDGESAPSGEPDGETVADGKEVESDEPLAVPAMAVPTLALPLLPYRPIEALNLAWSRVLDAAPAAEGNDESVVASVPLAAAPAPLPAQSAAPIFAAPRSEGSVLAAATAARVEPPVASATKVSSPDRKAEATPLPQAQPAAIAPAVEVAPQGGVTPQILPVATNPVLTVSPAGTVEKAVPRDEVSDALPMPAREIPQAVAAPVAAISVLASEPAATPRSAVSGLPAATFAGRQAILSEQLARVERPLATRVEDTPPTDGTPAVSEAPAAPAATLAGPRAILREPTRVESPLATPVEDTPPTDGTPAAKGVEVMPAIAIPVPKQPSVARSASRSLPLAETPTAVPLTAEGDALAKPEMQHIALPAAPEAKESASRERRSPSETHAESAEAPAMKGSPLPQSRVSAGAPRAANEFEFAFPTADHGAEVEADPVPVFSADTRVEVSAPAPQLFATSPETDRVKAEATAPAAPIDRAELVRLTERTADAAVRLRASGSERIEVAVQLASGDRLTIQLQLANGEVTPHFRTNSEGLRVALEQHWSQFTERASDRGVRLTPPVFDVNSSSSNMTDLSQQRHGRDTAYTDAQAELFPHLPRRMRPPRGLSASSQEPSPATTGVRAYA